MQFEPAEATWEPLPRGWRAPPCIPISIFPWVRGDLRMRTTPTDAHLARIFYAVLLNQARTNAGQCLRYKELLARARQTHPSDEVVVNAVPIGVGRRLEVIVQFAQAHRLPPLTCLAVNETGRPGASYKPVNGSWQADMDAVAAFDWTQWHDRWESHVQAVRRAATPLKRRGEAQARELLYQEFRAGRVGKLALDAKEQLVELLRDGLSFDDALQELQISR